MEKQTYKLWENGTPYFEPSYRQPETTVTFYPASVTKPTGCVIVFPGGGYSIRAEHEGKDICEMLNANGFHAFVLNYRLAPYKHPAELTDALRSIRFVRHNADKFGIKKDKIAILGFSAGGHLAITAAEHFDYGLGKDAKDEIDRESSRPDGAVFCYAVSTMVGEYSHEGSRINITGEREEGELAHLLSGEENVRADMPPVFIWHTFEDTCVPVENALMLAGALRKKRVPVEMHIFPTGEHGLGLAPSVPHTAQWSELLCRWLEFYDFRGN